MRALIHPHVFSGAVTIPGSKSHIIRRLIMAALTEGVSRIERPPDSLDTRSCAAGCRILGADITEEHDGQGKLTAYTINGISGGVFSGTDKVLTIDVGNSGTTLFLALAAAALLPQPFTFTGDGQIARRSAAALLDALAGLGVTVTSNNGCTPITVCGPWKGGRVSVSCPTSQYLSALLIAAPLAPAGVITEIEVPLLNEKPYVEMTLAYLEKQGLPISHAPDLSCFRITGGHSYKPMNGPVPGDFSSAAFPAAAAAISGGTVTLLGLDPGDPQGDKVFFDHLVQMGCSVKWESESGNTQGGWKVTVSRSGPLWGGSFDLNATPDMLPVMAVLAAFAEGETALVNAAHARIKETDRIAVMAAELSKLGIVCTEKPDGLIIQGGNKKLGGLHNILPVKAPILLNGHGDHRIVMALSCAALGVPGLVEIDGAEAADVSYPGFLELLNARCYT
jgi:3-phosphoshikimate 1-carboxyvinyltransferase